MLRPQEPGHGLSRNNREKGKFIMNTKRIKSDTVLIQGTWEDPTVPTRDRITQTHSYDRRLVTREYVKVWSWTGYEDRFVIHNRGWRSVWNKSRGERVTPATGWRAVNVIKWLPSKQRFDGIDIIRKRRGTSFATSRIKFLDLPDEVIKAIYEWMQMVPGMQPWAREAIFVDSPASAPTVDAGFRYIMERPLWENRSQFPLVRNGEMRATVAHDITLMLRQPTVALGLKAQYPGFFFPKRFQAMVAKKIVDGEWNHLISLDVMTLACGFDHLLPVAEACKEWWEFSRLQDGTRYGGPDDLNPIDEFNGLTLGRKLRIVQAENGLSEWSDTIRMTNHLRNDNVVFEWRDYPNPHEAHAAATELMTTIRQRRTAERRAFELKARSEILIPQDHYENVLAAPMPEGITLVSPKTAADMDEWSNAMENCIASYVTSAVQDPTALFLGILKDDVLIGNIEIRRRELEQILGRHNCVLPDDIRFGIHACLVDANVINQSPNAWGLQVRTPWA